MIWRSKAKQRDKRKKTSKQNESVKRHLICVDSKQRTECWQWEEGQCERRGWMMEQLWRVFTGAAWFDSKSLRTTFTCLSLLLITQPSTHWTPHQCHRVWTKRSECLVKHLSTVKGYFSAACKLLLKVFALRWTDHFSLVPYQCGYCICQHWNQSFYSLLLVWWLFLLLLL